MKKIKYILNLMFIIIFPTLNGCDKGADSFPQDLSQPSKANKRVSPLRDLSKLKNRIENFDNVLSYCEFKKLQAEGFINEDQADELIDHAYANNNPILFKEASKKIAAQNYSLNFLWLSTLRVDKTSPLTGDNEEQFQKHLLLPLKDWQQKQPEQVLNFWYDGNLTEASSLILSEKKLVQAGVNMDKVRLRNIRDIPIVKTHSALFAEAIPIYFKVDLAKAAIADYVLSIDKVPYVATIDSDVAAITNKQLFDQRTLDALKLHGYIFGVSLTERENSFILLHNNPEFDVVALHKKEVLDNAIAIVEEKLRKLEPFDAQVVYWRYPFFRRSVGALRGKWENEQGLGKNMIFPPSIHGGGGFSDSQLNNLKSALLGPEGCH